jgi:plastocyanin
MMKQIHAVVFGIGAFFAMNCGSGEGGYPEPTGGSGSAAQGQQPAQSTSASESESNGAAAADADGASVAVNGHTFDPPEVRIKAGQAVKWTWVAGSHNVVSGATCTPDGKFTSGSTVGPGSTFEHTFDKPGTFPYYCDPHCGIGMTGKVIVE